MDDAVPRKRIAAVLLAAGMSTRMGDFKQLMPFRGQTIIEACLDTVLASDVDETLVVTGHRAEEVEAAIARFGVRTVRNEDYATGMSSSVLAAVRSIGPGTHGMLVALCDQPHVPVDVFNTVIAAYRANATPIVVPAIAGDSGHPAIFDLSLRDEILGIDPAKGLRTVTYAHRTETLRVPVDSISILDDIDTMDDYQRLR